MACRSHPEGFCVLRASIRILPEYLFAFTNSVTFVKALSDLVRGALYPAVTDGQVYSQPLPLPPFSVQESIAASLNEQLAAVGKARNDAETQLKEINALPSSLLRKAFNGEL